jgi:hypothetical protein
MKIITVTYTGTYSQDFEVPDDQDLSPKALYELSLNLVVECDWSDGGAAWRPYMVEIDDKCITVD